MADRPPLLYESDFRHLFIACDSGNVETVKSLLEKYNSDTVSLFINQWDERTDETPLFRAAMRGHHEIVLTLLQYQANPDLVNQNKVGIIYHRKGESRYYGYWSALMIASSNDDTEMAKILLDHRADIKLRERNDDRGTSALIIAVQRGHHETVKLLLERGADANEGLRTFDSYQHKILKYGYIIATVSVLMFACEKGYARIARILLEFGANVNFSNEIGLSALIIVCSRGDIEIVHLLLDFGAEINVRCTETPEILLEYDVDVNDYDTLALLAAVRGGHTEIAKLLLEHGADVNMLDNSGTSALLIAVRNRHAKTAELLLEHGADVDTMSDSVFLDIIEYGHTGAEMTRLLLEFGADMNVLGKSAFFNVIRDGHTESAKLLLELGVDVNLPVDNYGRSALLIAIKHRDTKTAKLLLERGADVNMVGNDWDSGLIIACRKDCIDVVILLLEFGANIDIQDGTGWTALMYASMKGSTKIVEILLNHQPNLNLQTSNGNSALYLAITYQHIEICKLLLRNGASLKLKYPYVLVHATIFTECSKGTSVLMVACAMKGSLTNEIVKLLLDYEDDINMLDASGWSALAHASRHGNDEKTKLLLEHGAHVNLQHTELKGRSALQIASEGCYTSTTEILLEYGADVNMQDNDGWSALMLTSQDGYTETAKVLLEHQANVNQQKNDGWSALMIASYNGETEMIKLLLQSNANVNLLEEEGWSALMIACKMYYIEVVKVLLAYGADVNILSNNGWSALMIASYVGYPEICEHLLKYGAHVGIQDDYGWSALRAASYEGHHEIIELLKKFGASSGHNVEGVENLKAETILIVTNSEQHFSWDQFGLNIYVPQDSLPEEVEQCTIHIEVNTMGNHQLPQNTYLVSPVYSIKCIPKCQFNKSLILDIQHCAKQGSIHKLCFIRSTSANKGFDMIDSGDDKADHVDDSCFPQHCSYGYIELYRFCKYAAAQTQTERDSCERVYRVNIFYEEESASRYKVHFVILWNTSAHNQMVCDYYEKKNAKLELDQPLEFKGKQIELNIPFSYDGPTGITFENNRWKILSLNPPVIKKIEVDTFLSGEDERRIPSCQLLVKCDKGELTDLDHIVKLDGARKPYDAFTISISADKTVTKKCHDQIAEGTLVRSELDTQLNFTTLLRELSGAVSADWDDIGCFLQLDQGSLDVIKRNHSSDASKCFREMIKLWLKQVNPHPSWSAIIEAIDILKHKSLAKRLRKKFL